MFVPGVTRTVSTLTARAAGVGGFRLPDPSAPGAPVNVAALSSTMLLAAQEAGQDVVRDREARRQGQAVLADLRSLQVELLRGGTGLRLAEALDRPMAEAADPALRSAIRSIRLRAAVEAARLRLYSDT
jgi:hypothetical protein